MSAFVCTAKHIAIVANRVVGQVKSGDAADLAEKMARLNVESVDYRYNETTSKEELDAFMAECRSLVNSKAVKKEKISDSRLLGAVSCFLYQSCESDAGVEGDTYQSLLRFENSLRAKGIESEGWSI